MNVAHDLFSEVPLGRCELYFFIGDGFSDKVKTVFQVVEVFGQLVPDPNFDVGGEVVAASWVHDCDSDFEDEEPDEKEKDEDAKEIGAKEEFENTYEDEGQDREGAYDPVFEDINVQAFAEHLLKFKYKRIIRIAWIIV